MIRESRRNNSTYRKHALAQLGDIVETLPSIDWFEQVHAIVVPVIDDILEGSEDMDVDSKQDGDPSTRTMCVTRSKSRNLIRAVQVD